MGVAAEAAREGDYLVSIGVVPTNRHLGYGYMECGPEWCPGSRLKRGLAYHEKPDAETAQRYLESGRFLWNANIFVWSLATILKCYARFVPRDFQLLKQTFEAGLAKGVPSPAPAFRLINARSIDHDILEQVGPDGDQRHLFLAFPGLWCDVGSFPTLRPLLRQSGTNALSGPVDAMNTRNCLLVSEPPFRLTAEGLHDLDVIANYRGDLLVSPRDDCQYAPPQSLEADARDIAVRQQVQETDLGTTFDLSDAAFGVINLRGITNLDIRIRDGEIAVSARSAAPMRSAIDLHIASDCDGAAFHAAALLVDSLADGLYGRKSVVLVPSAGKTAREIFRHLRVSFRDSIDWSRVIVVQMDEYEGVSCENPGSFAFQLREEFVDPMGVHDFLCINDPSGQQKLPPEGYERELAQRGGIDVILHGIGINGHLGFNEPGAAPHGQTSIGMLASETIRWNFSTSAPPAGFAGKGITLGLGTMAAARRAIVAAFGSEKRRAVRQAVDAFPSHEVPASLLQLHPNVAFVVDRRAYAG